MTNKEIAKVFNDLAGIMELHGENPFKIRSYQNAYLNLRKLQTPLSDLSEAELSAIKGVGKAISGKIRELVDTGELQTLKKYQEKTPEGVQEMLEIKGFGPKKIRIIWKELGVESVGELLYACNENRLIELKGFGHKTQEDLKNKLNYFLKSRHKFHFASLEAPAQRLLEKLQSKIPAGKIALVGELRRKCPIVSRIEILIASNSPINNIFEEDFLLLESKKEQHYLAQSESELPVTIHHCKVKEFGSKLFRFTGSAEFIEAFIKKTGPVDFKVLGEEAMVFDKSAIEPVAPELRENDQWIGKPHPQLITEKDIKGVIHTHTTYSDGLHSLEEMAVEAKNLGYEYIGITDHSKAAFYANGLKEDRVFEQMEVIDKWNEQLEPFKIFKGIESDILNDGSLDYAPEVLSRFDFIIASIHTNLRMDKEKATTRLIKAIENPYTTILGHPTGRLLLSREGYPIDHEKVIDCCAANGVAIELNANPYRLDLDWQWIPYAVNKGVMISINPDAHSKGGIKDIRFGVFVARKGGLEADRCLNSLNLSGFTSYLKSRKHLPTV